MTSLFLAFQVQSCSDLLKEVYVKTQVDQKSRWNLPTLSAIEEERWAKAKASTME